MRKMHIVKNNRDFNRIINSKKPNHYKYFIIYIENTEDNYKFGISVGKKLGTAVVRNKVKRRIRNIIDQFHYKNNFNCIIIVKKAILYSSYQDIMKEYEKMLKDLNLIKE